MTTPWRRRPSLFFKCRVPCGAGGSLGTEPTQFLITSRGIALAGEGLLTLGGEGHFPAPQEALAQAEFAGDLGKALALGRDAADRLGLELAGVVASRLGHLWVSSR